MANLQDILANAQHGDAMDLLARAYGLTPEQTQAAVEALLPAISLGLKRTTATPEGLGALFSVAAQQPQLFAMYEDPGAALSPQGVAAGNAALANMFGSPEASRAVAAHAQQLSGVGGAILKKILPVLVGMILSGLMRGGSGQAAPALNSLRRGNRCRSRAAAGCSTSFARSSSKAALRLDRPRTRKARAPSRRSATFWTPLAAVNADPPRPNRPGSPSPKPDPTSPAQTRRRSRCLIRRHPAAIRPSPADKTCRAATCSDKSSRNSAKRSRTDV